MYSGIINKMQTEYDTPIKYNFVVGDNHLPLNELLNNKITLKWFGQVECICRKRFTKFYRQNFCYQCYWNAPQASQSIFKPELCTADLGIEERNLEWEKQFQLSAHYVYLANSSGIKVGITRKNQKLTRWMDQGATQAILVAEVPNRRLSGVIELEFKKYMSDKTNWRKMLLGNPIPLNLVNEKLKSLEFVPSDLKNFLIKDNIVTELQYPVSLYPTKINSLTFEKTNIIEGKLMGIKGQYLIFDYNRVFNVRSHQGYIVDILF